MTIPFDGQNLPLGSLWCQRYNWVYIPNYIVDTTPSKGWKTTLNMSELR